MKPHERVAYVQRAAAGDGDALQRLLLEYHGPLRRLVESRLAPALRVRLDAEDVLQDAYVAAFRAIREGRDELAFADPAAFYGWLERIVLNMLHDAQRAARRRKRDVGREAATPRPPRDFATTCTTILHQARGSLTSPSRALGRQEAAAALLSSLARLTEEQRQVVRLRFLENVPVPEIAARLGKNETAVYGLCYRGLSSLREYLEPVTRAEL
jgi:RNA polymerase sigma-70 factor, ECF subfamily